MDFQFPPQLYPTFYNSGPPGSVPKHSAGSWGCYDRVRLQGGPGSLSSWKFTSRHQIKGETWRHSEPVPVPLLSPKNSMLWPVKPPDPLDFVEHMQNFFMDHCQDAFGCMGEILVDSTHFERSMRKRRWRDSVHKQHDFKMPMCSLSPLLADVVGTVPPQLLGSLLYEELTEQRARMLFSEAATGGALAFVPFSQNGSGSQHGCLLYPGNPGLDSLNFHKVELQHTRGGSSCVDASSRSRFQLKGPVRQISSASLFDDCCVAVRSDRLCGVWSVSESNEPRLLQVVNTREVATCISVSPHVLGEVLVASESGAANLWTVGRGMQKVREENQNLFFNAKSPWRWCEFSAHPRVMLYADRTGVELTDIRENPACSHTLFLISNTTECCSGERLILSRYMSDAHPFHHLITTQYSAYIMDERFPTVPMLKWGHLMQSPPMFCHVIPGSASFGSATGGSRTTKVLLGSQNSQEITLLQYSGGRAEACVSEGPPQSLLRPRDSLKNLPAQIPHRMDTANNRLSSSAAGLTCIQKTDGEECICILQLTEAGDIFYQILEPEQTDASPPPAAEDELLPQRVAQKTIHDEGATPDKTAEQVQLPSQLVVSDTSCDEDMIEPTQGLTAQRLVPETPERVQQVFVSDPELDEVNGLDVGVKDGALGENSAEERTGSLPVKISGNTLVTWKRWLQKLAQKSRAKKTRPHNLQLVTVQTDGLLPLSDQEGWDPSEEQRLQSLRRDLRACMSKRSLLLHGAVSSCLGPQDAIPLPNLVDTDAWKDPLSQRLTLSWQGPEAWRAWWEDELGLNRGEKIEALKRKRRKEKRAKRQSGLSTLSGSFTSSVSNLLDLDSFSEATGWSSATSQWAPSDTEGRESQLEDSEGFWMPRAGSPSTRTATTPRRLKDNRGAEQTPGTSVPPDTPKPESKPSGQRRNKRPADAYLSSLFGSQDEPSQHDGFLLEEPPLPSPRHSSQSLPQRRLDLSQDFTALTPFSQTLSQSQSSQGRLRLSQASQPKKKSRMGF